MKTATPYYVNQKAYERPWGRAYVTSKFDARINRHTNKPHENKREAMRLGTKMMVIQRLRKEA